MKNTPKCPMCRTPLKLSTIENKGQLHFYACYKCNYQLRMSPSKDFALEYAKAFVSLFPPIMRLMAGDYIKVRKLPDDFTVLNIDAGRGIMRLRSSYGYSKYYCPEDIDKWPWELEQNKGGQQ